MKRPEHFWGYPYHFAEYQLLRQELEQGLLLEAGPPAGVV
jgi:hypothetical protein